MTRFPQQNKGWAGLYMVESYLHSGKTRFFGVSRVVLIGSM